MVNGNCEFDNISEHVKAHREKLREVERLSDEKEGVVGEIIRFSVGDGYAYYMVSSEDPLEVKHLKFLDGYVISESYLNGLTLEDVKAKLLRKYWSV